MTPVDHALAEWRHSLLETTTKGQAAIRRYAMESCGWSWLRLTLAKLARQPWCGYFAGHCYRQAGLRLEHCRRDLPSTYRLDRWCREDERRRVALADLRAGDILVVGHKRGCRKAGRLTPQECSCVGAHITIVETVADNYWHTVEGNGRGMLPGGVDSGLIDGVIRRARHEREAKWGVRPLPGDYESRVINTLDADAAASAVVAALNVEV